MTSLKTAFATTWTVRRWRRAGGRRASQAPAVRCGHHNLFQIRRRVPAAVTGPATWRCAREVPFEVRRVERHTADVDNGRVSSFSSQSASASPARTTALLLVLALAWLALAPHRRALSTALLGAAGLLLWVMGSSRLLRKSAPRPRWYAVGDGVRQRRRSRNWWEWLAAELGWGGGSDLEESTFVRQRRRRARTAYAGSSASAFSADDLPSPRRRRGRRASTDRGLFARHRSEWQQTEDALGEEDDDDIDATSFLWQDPSQWLSDKNNLVLYRPRDATTRTVLGDDSGLWPSPHSGDWEGDAMELDEPVPRAHAEVVGAGAATPAFRQDAPRSPPTASETDVSHHPSPSTGFFADEIPTGAASRRPPPPPPPRRGLFSWFLSLFRSLWEVVRTVLRDMRIRREARVRRHLHVHAVPRTSLEHRAEEGGTAFVAEGFDAPERGGVDGPLGEAARWLYRSAPDFWDALFGTDK